MIILSQHLVPRDSEFPAVPPLFRILGYGEKNFFGAKAPTPSSQNLHQVSANELEPLCVKIRPWVTSVGESGKKIKIKIKKKGLIFHIFRQALSYGQLAQILGYVFVS